MSSIETREFSMARLLIGNPKRSDEELDNVLTRIAANPLSFPIVLSPETRMAVTENTHHTVGIFFRVFEKSEQAELQWLTLQAVVLSLAA